MNKLEPSKYVFEICVFQNNVHQQILYLLKQSTSKQHWKINFVEFEYNANALVIVSLIGDMPVRYKSNCDKSFGQRLKKLCQCQTAVHYSDIFV